MKRYDMNQYDMMEETAEGEYVLYKDVTPLVEAAEKIVKQPWVGTSVAQIHRDLRTALDALKAPA